MVKRKKDGTFDNGHDLGNRFTSDNQPKNAGRKPSRFKQLISQLSTANEEVITKDDYNNIITHLLTLTPDELKAVANNKNTPIAVMIIASSISGDIENRSLQNTEKLVERIFGKEPTKHEVNSTGLNINFVNHAND